MVPGHDSADTAVTGHLYMGAPIERSSSTGRDADGTRVAKGTITNWSAGCDTTQNGFTMTASYILGPGNEQLAELSWSGGVPTPVHTNVWAGGQLTATYSYDDPINYPAGILYFPLTDWLGTRRMLADQYGNLAQTCDSLPFGDGESCPATPTEHLFTGKERDTESGNDYFGARYYASSMGRFMSPDWSAKEEPVPYAKLDDPQTLNLYAYVGNNPLIRTDPTGHCSAGDIKCMKDNMFNFCGFRCPVASVPHTFKLPSDPSGLGSDWTQDTGHKNPNGSKWKNPDGWDLEFHKGKQGAKGFRGKDHWHLTPPGAEEKDDEHLAPGTEVTVTVPDPKPEPAAEPEDSRSAYDKVNDWLNDHLPQSVKDYLNNHPYGPGSSPAGAGPGPVVSPIWAEPW